MDSTTKFSGLALRTNNTILVTASANAVHKIHKRIWNDMDIEILYYTNNYFMKRSIKMIKHYNLMVNIKNYIDIDMIYDGCNNINELSWLGDDDDDDDDMTEYYLQQNINRLQRLYITNKIKLEDKKQKMDLDNFNDEIIENDIYDNINTTNVKLSQKILVNNIENKQFHELLENSSINTKVRLLSMKSNKCNAWLQKQIGFNIKSKYGMNNE